ncbi:hypothetical protein MSAN_01296100 [Mycena sanguinolenta]|uniref:Transmembrane protein n=1 Tax=Mycena sanguinolenta TaxID=230812 RepID=A0A8H7D2W8_9AGAR|nr:hypothetical protein MSAN_01296100 [Mycena sanguinolenta]
MGGPNLEVFKFAVYLFVPIVSLVYFGDPAWYHTHVVPYRNKLLPPLEKTVRVSIQAHWRRTTNHRQQEMPFEQHRVREELERIKNERLERRDAKDREAREAKARGE